VHKDNPYLPSLATIQGIEDLTSDVRLLRVTLPAGFSYLPGQCALLSILGVGESTISITSPPTQPEYMEFAIKRVGKVTEAIHEAEVGEQIGVRGPMGNHFPVEMMRGKNLLFVGGGIGLAPLRSMIKYAFDRRSEFGHIDVIYGARSPQDICFFKELTESWPQQPDTAVYLTVDRGDEAWSGHTGFVPAFLEEIAPSPQDCLAVTCGPPIMIKFVLQSLEKLGFSRDMIYTTLEMKMKCGLGKCGRCNIGDKYVCVDGPVFSFAELGELPNEF
jgi:NAD(P)H-flavin reductase